jgi:phage protein D
MADQTRLLEHFYIKLGGSEIPEMMEDLLEVSCESSLQLPDMAVVTLHDTRLKWIDDTRIKPGAELEISAKSEAGQGELFKGEIIEVAPEYQPGSARITFRAFDKLHRLTRGKKSRTFVEMTDGDIVSKLASEAGLGADVGPTRLVHKHIYQRNQTNLEFLRERAHHLGFVMYSHAGKLHFKPPDADGAEVLLKWRETLLEFRPRLTTAGQVKKSVARGWNYKDKTEVTSSAEGGNGQPAIGESSPGGQVAQQAFGIDAEDLSIEGVWREQAEADIVAKARIDQNVTGFVTAEGLAKGDPRIVAGAKVKVDNVGTKFGGTYVVTAAKHTIDRSQDGYTTEFVVSGHHVDSVLGVLDGRRSSPGDHVAIGIVTQNDDPDKMGRVKVKFPWLSPNDESNWARVVSPGAGKERGIQFLPEINDEVLVAFELGDINHPYVIGGLWNGQDALALEQGTAIKGSHVEQRIIMSRTKHQILIDDADGAGGITIEDRKGNIVKLQSQDDKLIVKTTGNVEIETKADVTIKATGNISMEATQEVEIKASMGVTIDGGAKVDVKGGIVNIN